MGRFKKAIATMLVACMTMVTPASLGMTKVSANEANKTKMSVYSIDAGRKFFSVNQIKEIIDTANKTGYTHVQLLFGNDGLRLVLDDMTITANGKTYASDDVKEAIKNGTKKYYDDPNGTVLTQKDMEAILAHAKSKNVKIIPVISSPGHMDAILNTMEALGIENPKFNYQGTVSKTTLDLNNAKAVEFTKELVEKYAKYFNGKVEYFNFGADEYANDATYHGPSKKSGFLVLQEEKLYDDFIKYINEISAMVKENNMKPICFNDGIYYNQDEKNGVVDTDITVAYWTPGFDRYSPAPAKYLIEKGFKILNTNDNWYYVVGRNGDGWWYGSSMATDSMKKFKFDRVVGTADNEKPLPIVGSMACTWCDEPQKEYKPEIVKGLMELFANQNKDYIYPKANYAKVEDAIKKAPKDLTKYTEETAYNLNRAIASVTYGEKLADQAKVDAMANEITKATANLKVATSKKKKSAIFSIDAGRKYFSKDQLIEIIEKAHRNGYTDVQLILGNDGLRFALDNMDIKVNGKTYKSEDVKKAITKGNDIYYKDPNGDYLTEAEMDEILTVAKRLGMGVIPVINSPGHMDGILNAMEALGIKNPQYSHNGKKSTRTIDLNNKEAIEFNKELVKKYATYFAKKGSKIFNFGCDEYANDIDSSEEGYYNGWSRLHGEGMYPKFVTYVNDLSKIIKDAGMKPMCFNDGIYYNKKDEYGKFDKDIIISYWTAGWWEFYTAPAAYLYDKGHQIVNLNDGWYWVLGSYKTEDNKLPYKYEDAMANIEKFDYNKVAGDSLGVPTIASMQAVWCDEPSKKHEMDKIMNLMDAYSAKHTDYLKRPGMKVNVAERIEGETRYETSLEVSKKAFSKSEKAYLVSGEKFPDALSAASLTANGNGPILLVNDKTIDKVLAEVDRLNAKEIVLVGGGSISASNKNKVKEFAKSHSATVSELAGKDRFDTAVKVANKTISTLGNKGKVIIADGRNYPDAVSIAPYASKEGIPVLLANGNNVSKEVKDFVAKNNIKEAIIVGGDKAVGKEVEKLFKKVDRISGANRYETSAKIAEKFFASTDGIFMASGEAFADSLSVSYYASQKNTPVVLTIPNRLHDNTRKYMENNKYKNYYVIGGENAVTSNIFK